MAPSSAPQTLGRVSIARSPKALGTHPLAYGSEAKTGIGMMKMSDEFGTPGKRAKMSWLSPGLGLAIGHLHVLSYGRLRKGSEAQQSEPVRPNLTFGAWVLEGTPLLAKKGGKLKYKP